MKRPFVVALLSAFALTASVAFAQDAINDDPIEVGSKQFTEQIVLGKVIIHALRDANFDVTDRTNLGGTAVNRDALVAGEIDVYPEYTGTAISNWYRDDEEVQEFLAEGGAGDAEATYELIKERDAERHDLVWLERAPANNTYALAVTSQWSEENDVTTMNDFAEYVNDGGEVVLATNDEFAQRPDGLQAFEETYGFDLSEDQLIIIAGATPAQTEQALAEGASGVNVAMAFGTDGALQAYDFVVLEDPDGAQPVFQPTPVFRGEVIRDFPQIADILDPIFATFDTTTLQDLNAQVEVEGLNAEAVARTYLEENGFIGN